MNFLPIFYGGEGGSRPVAGTPAGGVAPATGARLFWKSLEKSTRRASPLWTPPLLATRSRSFGGISLLFLRGSAALLVALYSWVLFCVGFVVVGVEIGVVVGPGVKHDVSGLQYPPQKISLPPGGRWQREALTEGACGPLSYVTQRVMLLHYSSGLHIARCNHSNIVQV